MRRVAEVVGIAQPVEVGLRKRALESGIRDRAAKGVSECAVIICVTAAGQVPRSTERAGVMYGVGKVCGVTITNSGEVGWERD